MQNGSWWYHGQESAQINFSRSIFLSQSINTAARYGKNIFCIWVPHTEIFDTGNAEQIRQHYGDMEIEDPFSGEIFETVDDFLAEHSSDTWEAFEALGLPPESYIYEGGERNLYLERPLDILDTRFIYRMPNEPMYTAVSTDLREAIMENGLGFILDEDDVIFTSDLSALTGQEHDIWEVDACLVAMVPTSVDNATTWKLMNRDEAPLRQVITSEFSNPSFQYPSF